MRIELSDPNRAADLRAYFRRLDAVAVENEDRTLEVYLLRPVSARDEERDLVRAYLQIWVQTDGVPAALLE